jgi:hypothetical protein
MAEGSGLEPRETCIQAVDAVILRNTLIYIISRFQVRRRLCSVEMEIELNLRSETWLSPPGELHSILSEYACRFICRLDRISRRHEGWSTGHGAVLVFRKFIFYVFWDETGFGISLEFRRSLLQSSSGQIITQVANITLRFWLVAS